MGLQRPLLFFPGTSIRLALAKPFLLYFGPVTLVQLLLAACWQTTAVSSSPVRPSVMSLSFEWGDYEADGDKPGGGGNLLNDPERGGAREGRGGIIPSRSWTAVPHQPAGRKSHQTWMSCRVDV